MWDNHAVLGFPVTLLLMVIISSLILSFFAISSGFLCSTVQNNSIEESLNHVINLVSTMESFSHEESSIIVSLSFPDSVECVVFGNDKFDTNSITDMNNSFAFESSTKSIFYELKNGYNQLIYSSISFYDENGLPFVLHEGTYSVKFSLTEKNDEVCIIAQIL